MSGTKRKGGTVFRHLLFVFLAFAFAGFACKRVDVSSQAPHVEHPSSVEGRVLGTYARTKYAGFWGEGDASLLEVPESERARLFAGRKRRVENDENVVDYGIQIVIRRIEISGDKKIVVYNENLSWTWEHSSDAADGTPPQYSSQETCHRVVMISERVVSDEYIDIDHPEFEQLRRLPKLERIIIRELPRPAAPAGAANGSAPLTTQPFALTDKAPVWTHRSSMKWQGGLGAVHMEHHEGYYSVPLELVVPILGSNVSVFGAPKKIRRKTSLFCLYFVDNLCRSW